MLAQRKPLAYFVDGKGWFPEIVWRYLRFFEPHVAAGRLMRRDHFSSAAGLQSSTLHHILFALPEEEWRIGAMLDLVLNQRPWSIESERRQGELLGYEDWMNDYWLAQIYGR